MSKLFIAIGLDRENDWFTAQGKSAKEALSDLEDTGNVTEVRVLEIELPDFKSTKVVKTIKVKA